jgi:hypothetical protein
MGYAAEQRQLAGLGMAQSQHMVNQQAAMMNQMMRFAGQAPDLSFGKPTKTVCAYCGGPDYKERSCPGCGAREKGKAKCSD